MILADTSIWVRYLSGRAPYLMQMQALLASDEIAAHDLVYGELLAGDIGGRGLLLARYDRIRRARHVPHGDVVAMVRAGKLHGRGAGWIDMHLLASARVSGFSLWTADLRLAGIADELGIAWHPAR